MSDITQKDLKQAMGIPVSNSWNGRDYANRVNMKARDRLANFRASGRRIDCLQAVNRFKWSNLPVGLRSTLMERILYFKAQAIFFWDSTLNQYFFLPYTLTSEGDNAIDVYGQYQMVKPLPFNGKADAKTRSGGKKTAHEIYFASLIKKPIYDDESLKAVIADKGKDWCKENCCIICNDYTQGLSQYIQPLSILQESWIVAQSEIPLFFRTAIFKALMPKLVKTSDQGTMDAILAELQTVEDSILEGKTLIPVTAFQDLQDIDSASQVGTLVETILKSYDSMDNIRKTQLGIATTGAFKKESGMNPNEQEAQDAVDLILADALNNRQRFSDLVNELFDLNIYPDEGQGLDEEHEAKFEEKEAEEMAKMDEGKGGNLSND